MSKNPRTTKEWKVLNETDYSKALNEEDKAYLDNFNVNHFKEHRSNTEALNQPTQSITEADTELELKELICNVSRSKTRFELTDVKMWIDRKKGLSEREVARKYKVAKSTVRYRTQLIDEKFVENLEPEMVNELFGIGTEE